MTEERKAELQSFGSVKTETLEQWFLTPNWTVPLGPPRELL